MSEIPYGELRRAAERPRGSEDDMLCARWTAALLNEVERLRGGLVVIADRTYPATLVHECSHAKVYGESGDAARFARRLLDGEPAHD